MVVVVTDNYCDFSRCFFSSATATATILDLKHPRNVYDSGSDGSGEQQQAPQKQEEQEEGGVRMESFQHNDETGTFLQAHAEQVNAETLLSSSFANVFEEKNEEEDEEEDEEENNEKSEEESEEDSEEETEMCGGRGFRRGQVLNRVEQPQEGWTNQNRRDEEESEEDSEEEQSQEDSRSSRSNRRDAQRNRLTRFGGKGYSLS